MSRASTFGNIGIKSASRIERISIRDQIHREIFQILLMTHILINRNEYRKTLIFSRLQQLSIRKILPTQFPHMNNIR
jgi:hypothetical protein